jgi:hypothetical protein
MAAAVALAAAMVAINFGFEAAGSVPDLEACGFLAGNWIVLLGLYPVAAAVVAARVARLLVRRFPEADEDVVRMGGRAGAIGAGAYFGGGILTLLAAGHGTDVPILAWLLLPLYTFSCFLAGRLGASLTVEKRAHVALQNSEG